MQNGNGLLTECPPQSIDLTVQDPLPVPYLDGPPPVIPIDGGRQLFVDDYLVAESTLQRSWHRARIHEASPVLKPETELELNRGRCPVAAPFNDGVWYDAAEGRFKMWYHAGWFDGTALATSRDGLNWERPSLGVVPGTNAVVAPPAGHRRDGGLVWLDADAPPAERFKMFLYFRHSGGEGGEIYSSSNGVDWVDQGPTSPCGDNSSFFYNPFRKRYVFSIRDGSPVGRARFYAEAPTFAAAAQWGDGRVPWARTDGLDKPDPLVGDTPQLYDLNAVAYESVLLGAFAVFYGPQNEVCARTGEVKIIDLQIATSRDGFHWHRPCRSPFIACSRRRGAWDCGYLHAAGGLCLVVGDELWFYFGAFSGASPVLAPGQTGDYPQENAMYAGASTGLATLRRDGFASLDAGEEEGELVTRPVTFTGEHLFVNVDARNGALRVEVLDEDGATIPGFSADQCVPVTVDSTRHRVVWEGEGGLGTLARRPLSFRFRLRHGSLYSFWVSPTTAGESGGYLAAGGPGFSGLRDE